MSKPRMILGCSMLALCLCVVGQPGLVRATCMEQLKEARAVTADCSELKGPLPMGMSLHFAAVWEVCCSAPPSPDAGTGPDISCIPYSAPTYYDPAKEFKLLRLEAGGKEVPVQGKVVSLEKQCSSAGLFRFDGQLQPGARYRLTYQGAKALEVEVEVAVAMDGGFLMDCLAGGDGAPPEDPALADRGCTVGGSGAGGPAALLLLLLAWRRRST